MPLEPIGLAGRLQPIGSEVCDGPMIHDEKAGEGTCISQYFEYTYLEGIKDFHDTSSMVRASIHICKTWTALDAFMSCRTTGKSQPRSTTVALPHE